MHTNPDLPRILSPFYWNMQGEEQKDETVVDAEFKEKEKDEEKK